MIYRIRHDLWLLLRETLRETETEKRVQTEKGRKGNSDRDLGYGTPLLSAENPVEMQGKRWFLMFGWSWSRFDFVRVGFCPVHPNVRMPIRLIVRP